MPNSKEPLSLAVLDQYVRIECSSKAARSCLQRNFAAMAAPTTDTAPDLQYSVRSSGSSFLVEPIGGTPFEARGLYSLAYGLDKALTIALQHRRRELLFLHAAAVELRGRSVLLAADSGSGKSTTTWALLHHGFGYMSDELGPVDCRTLEVFPYPRALCLKKTPPAPYSLPTDTMRFGKTFHIPTASMPGPAVDSRRKLSAIFLVKYDRKLIKPRIARLRAAEAAARLYPTALNALAHQDFGLAPVLHISRSVPCFSIATAGLAESCELICSAIA